MNLFKLFHHWLNPHCIECRNEQVCESCTMLKLLLEQERQQNSILLEKIIREPVKEEVRQIAENEPIRPKFVPWRIKQAELEHNDRIRAEVMKKKVDEMKMENVDVSKLENELGIVAAKD